MTETRFYELARLSTPPKPVFLLKPLDANLVQVIVIKVFLLGYPVCLFVNRANFQTICLIY